MKALIFAGGTDGDIHPQFGIGQALVARGHQVVAFTTQTYVDLADRCGFQTVDLFSRQEKLAFARTIKDLRLADKIKYCRKLISSKISVWCEQAAAHIDHESVVIAPPGLSIVARLLQEKYQVPYLTTLFAPSYLLFLSLREPAAVKALGWYRILPYQLRKPALLALESLLLDPLLHAVLKESTGKMGLPLPRRISSQWQYSPQKILGLFDEWFCPAPGDWPSQLCLTGFPLFDATPEQEPLQPRLQAFLQDGTPPVVFTPGTRVKNSRAFFIAALKALQQLGLRGIFLTRAADQVPELPASVLHETYLPLNQILPRTSALVHHGGIGTTAQALYAGTPQLLMPGHSDQYDNARRVEQLGCGLVLKKTAGAAALVGTLHQLLGTGEIANRCRAIRAGMVSGPVACGRAADEVERVFLHTRQPEAA